MPDKFQNKYHIPSARLQSWDYGSNAMYFVTICTQNRECYFGNVANGKMILSPVGAIANVLWYEVKHHSKNIKLGEFIIMPNHVHGIIIIDKPDNTISVDDAAGTLNVMSLSKDEFMSNISPKTESLSTIIRSYKSAVSKHANRLGFEFQWQSRFYDIIIRNDKSFQRISNYIINNPLKWKNDIFFDNESKKRCM